MKTSIELTRRAFLRLGTACAASLVNGPGIINAMETALGGKDYSPTTGRERRAVPYTCLVCNVEDGGLAFIENNRVVKLEGNPKHVSTRGRLCAKGNAGHLHIYDPDRILYPLKRTGPRGSGQWKRVSWDNALDEVAERIREVLDKGKPNEIMFKYGRDRTGGAIERFMNTLGSNTIINHTSVCESSKKVGMEDTWGPDIELPDFANTKYVLNFGSNILEASYFHNPFSQRITEGWVENKAKWVTFDVRLSNTATRSDEWHPIFPGTDGIIALAIGNVILSEGLADEDFINTWTNVSVRELKEHYRQFTPEMAGQYSGVPSKEIIRIAREFAGVRPYCTTFSYSGPCKHLYGAYNERAQMMLNVLVGNIEHKGGYCLPRAMGFRQPQPVPEPGEEPSYLSSPPHYPLASHKVSHLVPFWIREGRQKVSIYFTYVDNPVYTNPGAEAVWGKLLKDEKLIPYFVSFSPYMSETTRYADIILPNAVFLERFDPESMPSSLWPWLGIRQPVVKPLGKSQDVRWTLKHIIDRVDPDGSRNMKTYWDFSSPEDYVRRQFDGIPGLAESGGWEFLRRNGVWPIYGKLDPATGKIVDRTGLEIRAEYGLHRKELSPTEMVGAMIDPRTGTIFKKGRPIGVRVKGKNYVGFGTSTRKIHVRLDKWETYGFNPMPVWKQEPWLSSLEPDKLVLTTFKWNIHTQSRTASIKWLSEMVHSNPAWINRRTADERGIKDGDLIRITSGVGYMITKARVTEGIHPRVVAISTSCGHWAYGRLAQLKQREQPPKWSQSGDPDIDHNVWWKDMGVHPNEIIPVIADPIGGSQAWFSTVVTVTRARGKDTYGDIKSDSKKHYEFFKFGERYAYTGDLHREMHPEVMPVVSPEQE